MSLCPCPDCPQMNPAATSGGPSPAQQVPPEEVARVLRSPLTRELRNKLESKVRPGLGSPRCVQG